MGGDGRASPAEGRACIRGDTRQGRPGHVQGTLGTGRAQDQREDMEPVARGGARGRQGRPLRRAEAMRTSVCSVHMAAGPEEPPPWLTQSCGALAWGLRPSWASSTAPTALCYHHLLMSLMSWLDFPLREAGWALHRAEAPDPAAGLREALGGFVLRELKGSSQPWPGPGDHVPG